MIDDTSIIARKPDLITADDTGNDRGEAVVLNAVTGMFFQLNPSAARVWEMVETPQTLAALVAHVTERFDVTAEACRADLVALIEDLRERGLVERV